MAAAVSQGQKMVMWAEKDAPYCCALDSKQVQDHTALTVFVGSKEHPFSVLGKPIQIPAGGAALVKWLSAQSPTEHGQLVLGTFEENRRASDKWLGASGVEVDADYQRLATDDEWDNEVEQAEAEGRPLYVDAGYERAALPDEVHRKLEEAARAGKLPGNAFNVTPRGVRFRFLSKSFVPKGYGDIHDQQSEYRVFAGSCVKLVEAALRDLGLLFDPGVENENEPTQRPRGQRAGLEIDPVWDKVAQCYRLPNRIKDGEVLRPTIHLLREEPYSLAELPYRIPKPKRPTRQRLPGEETDLDQAVVKFNEEHAEPGGRRRTPCPMCGSESAFERRDNGQRWNCYSSSHRDGGREERSYWFGDVLDIAAYEAGVDRLTLLEQEGYWSRAPKADFVEGLDLDNFKGADVQEPDPAGAVVIPIVNGVRQTVAQVVEPKPQQIPEPKPTKDDDEPKNPYEKFGDFKKVKYCLPVLNHGFRVFRESNGRKRWYSVNERNEVVLQEDDDNLRIALHNALKKRFGMIPPERLLGESITLWGKEAESMKHEPEPFTFGDDPRLTFKHFDWVPTEGAYPAWEEFLCRLSDRDFFMAFVWSCFEPKNRARQYCWLYGKNGQDGKSSVLGLLYRVFGEAGMGITDSHVGKNGNQFTNSLFYGKRVVVYADCRIQTFGMSGTVRAVTGRDPVLIEYKGERAFSAPIYCKLFVGSNYRPKFTGANPDISRASVIDVEPAKVKDDPEWEARLEAELPAFLWACREKYAVLCPKGGDIKMSDESEELKKQIASEFEGEYADIFDKYFVATGVKNLPNGQVEGLEVEAHIVRQLLQREGVHDNIRQGDFKDWMERTHGIVYRNSGARRRYVGLKLNQKTADSYVTIAKLAQSAGEALEEMGK